MLDALLANPQLLAELEKPRTQQLASGLLSLSDLAWEQDWITTPGGLQVVRKALIPSDRLPDLLKGIENETTEFSLWIRSSQVNPAGSLKRPKADSFLFLQRHHCSFGPEDNRSNSCQIQDPASKPAKGEGSRRQRTALGQSIKRGCQYGFCSKQLYKWPDVTEITLYNDQHLDQDGQPCHGSDDSTSHNTRAAFCPRLSNSMREWVVQQLRMGLTIQKIMSLHNKQLAAKLEHASAGHR